MLKIEETEVNGWQAAIRGMRNPKNSWNKSDSEFPICDFPNCEYCSRCDNTRLLAYQTVPKIGPNDYNLMLRLIRAGRDERKFLRFITVTADITGPLYWWKEFDTYKVGTVANSCSTMHELLSKPFKMSDFSLDKIPVCEFSQSIDLFGNVIEPFIETLNELRNLYFYAENEKGKKEIWYTIVQLLPSSYNQKRTVLLNYEVLRNMYHARKNHKLDEWKTTFCKWAKNLPYSQLITTEAEK